MASYLYLDLLVNGAAVHRFELQVGRQKVGRSAECPVRLLDTTVSSVHALLTVIENPLHPHFLDVLLTDMNSTNGTWKDGQRIAQVRLMLGDTFRCGDAELMLNGADGAMTTQTEFAVRPGE